MFLGNILVVDDDLNLLELVKMRLESANYEVTAASIEEEALGALKERVFDLAIVDLQLAHQDGISLMEAFHQIIPDMPVVILTAHGSIESAVEAMKKGAYSYLTKPFDAQELAAADQNSFGEPQAHLRGKKVGNPIRGAFWFFKYCGPEREDAFHS